MSVRALIETVVNLDTFLNVDLYCQGYYYVKLKLYSERPDQNIVSKPITRLIQIYRESLQILTHTT